MTSRTEHSARRLYTGLNSILVRWFRVPFDPPTLPTLPSRPNEFHLSFQPSEGFLRYLKFWFWLLLPIADIGIAVAWIATFFVEWWLFLLLTPIALFLIFVPDIIAYLAIHLRYDTTWYVMTDRSLRIRRGIWVIHEVTITFENVQNVSLRQGPLQRHYGISTLMVQTAGGGSAQAGSHGAAASGGGHHGIIEGINNAPELRDRILARLRQSPTAGLGDEAHAPQERRTSGGWRAAHLAVLGGIRDEIRHLATKSAGF